MSFSTLGRGALQRATRKEGVWTLQDIRRTQTRAAQSALESDSAGHIHVAYSDGELVYGSYDGVRWTFETVTARAETISPQSLALDSRDRPRCPCTRREK